MEEVMQQNNLKSRLLLFPMPFQGHARPMIHLANILSSRGFLITIIQTRYKSLNHADFPHFTFHVLEDGLSEKITPSPSDYTPVISALNANCEELFRDTLSEILSEAAETKQEHISCLIADPLWFFAGSVANSFNMRRIVLRTGSMSTFVVYDSLPDLLEKGYYPIQETRLDEPVPELTPLKVKDLPPELQHGLEAAVLRQTKTSQGVICNTFEDLEGIWIARARPVLSIPIYSLGPMHINSDTSAAGISGQDSISISWLNTQAPKSVLYVSFGSIVVTTEAEFLEIAWGLANSKQPFLWVVRPGLIQDLEPKSLLPEGYLNKVEGRGQIVEWAPQPEVLAHPAVGGFWSHCGWNSTVESISEGVPMLCQPSFADQAINARHVCDGWKVGLQMEKGATRKEIERAIRKLMVEEEGKDMRSRITTLKEKAYICLREGGSSYQSLENLKSYISSL